MPMWRRAIPLLLLLLPPPSPPPPPLMFSHAQHRADSNLRVCFWPRFLPPCCHSIRCGEGGRAAVAEAASCHATEAGCVFASRSTLLRKTRSKKLLLLLLRVGKHRRQVGNDRLPREAQQRLQSHRHIQINVTVFRYKTAQYIFYCSPRPPAPSAEDDSVPVPLE